MIDKAELIESAWARGSNYSILCRLEELCGSRDADILEELLDRGEVVASEVKGFVLIERV